MAKLTKPPLCCGRAPSLTNGREIYPHIPEISDRSFYVCRLCGAYVGCHKGTTFPLGTVAKKELRALRVRVHIAFDPLWKGKDKCVREACYSWLASKLGIAVRNCHIGLFDEERCRQALKVLEKEKS